MEEDYDWSLILKSSVPIAVAAAFISYTNIAAAWKWSALVIGASLAAMIVYMNDKKKANVFTAAAIVFLAALAVMLLKGAGLL